MGNSFILSQEKLKNKQIHPPLYPDVKSVEEFECIDKKLLLNDYMKELKIIH